MRKTALLLALLLCASLLVSCGDSLASFQYKNGKYAVGKDVYLPADLIYEPTYVEREPEIPVSGEFTIERYDETWVIESPWLERMMANVNFSDYESRNWFDKMLRQSGLYDRLEEMGIHDGDTVSLYNLEFEYQR